MKLISVCIPTHGMKGLGHVFLRENFEKLYTQTFKDFEIIVSDHSNDDLIKNLCLEYKDKLDVKYFKNTEGVGFSSININNAIKKATGKLIKILFLDDFLYSDKSLEEIYKNFDQQKDHWLVTACEHSKDGVTFYRKFFPRYNKRIYLGNNTISSPSVLTVKNENPLLFDEKLTWLMDVDYYKRYYDKYGLPKILNSINVVNRTGEHQGSGGYKKNDLRETNKLKNDELAYLINKFNINLTTTDKIFILKNKLKDFIKNKLLKELIGKI